MPGHFCYPACCSNVQCVHGVLAAHLSRFQKQADSKETGGDNSNKRCLSNTRSQLKSSRKFGSSSRILRIHSRMSRFFSTMSRNYRVFRIPEKFPSVPIPGEISRFPEQFWLCPETAFVRVVTPRKENLSSKRDTASIESEMRYKDRYSSLL